MNYRPLISTVLALAFAASLVGCSRKAIVVKQGRIAAFNNPINLDLAHRQWEAIKLGDAEVIDEYNETVGNVISQISFRLTKRPNSPIFLKTTSGDLPLIVDNAGIENQSNVDRLVPVKSIRVKRGLRSETKVEGVGAPLVVRQRWTPRDPMIATTGLWYPVTGILDLDDPMQPIMRFMDPHAG